MLTVGGLFSGIGGWELGLERAGMCVVWHCEQDPFCQRVLARHWPGVPCYPDVRALVGHANGAPSDPYATAGASRPATSESGGGLDVPVSVPPVDVLCGGFPCQDISSAGAGAGIDGERSGLWSEYARLVGELRPRYVLVENVSALLARGLGRVLSDLSALGYDAEWDCIPASAVGAPHRRDRVWVVAYPNGDGEPHGAVDAQAPGDEASPGRRDVAHPARLPEGGASPEPRPVGERVGAGRERGGAHVADTAGERSPDRDAGALQGFAVAGRPTVEPERRSRALGDTNIASADAYTAPGRSRRATRESSGWLTEPDVGRVAHGIPARVDRLRSLGNALVPQISEWIGRRIVDWEAVNA